MSSSTKRTLRAILLVAATLAVTACGGGSTGTGAPPVGQFCDPGTQVVLARPFPGQSGVPTSTTQIEIVANGNNNTLYTSYQSFDLILQPAFGGSEVVSTPLSLTSDPSGPHPYPSDFYYFGSINAGALFAGQAYTVLLNANSGCTFVLNLGSFST